ncbi:MAG TPA: CHRD domain-containing protein [Verrucomicrobiae bacterium]
MKTSRLFSEQDQTKLPKTPVRVKMLGWFTVLALLAILAPSAVGREWRVGQLPNGNAFSCANCHTSAGGGGPRNSFGQAVEQRVSPGSFDEFWDAALAALDSDGDGFSNGTELRDPDGDGQPSASTGVTNPGNAASRPASAPTVSITNPANNATFTAPASVTITANAAVTGSTISSVQFFEDGNSLGADNASPFSVTATLPVGTHVLTARATAANGQSTTSSGITVTVSEAQVPTIAITSPANNATLNSTTFTINADTSVQGGTVTMVEFYADGSNWLGMVHGAPWSVSATLTEGLHVLTAVATASSNSKATSAPVNITIRLGGEPITNPFPAMVKSDTTIELQTVADGMVAPLGMAAPNDGTGRLFVFDQVGLVYVITNGTRLESPLLDMRSQLVPLQAGYDERGLLGLALHPNFAQNGLLYTYASESTGGAADFPIDPGTSTNNHQTVLVEWKIDTANINRVDPASRREMMRIDQPQFNHNGGVMHFGQDGMLYLALGDGGNRDDEGLGHSPQGNGQDLSKILGKMIRIDVNTRNSVNGKYGVPTDNPFAGATAGLDEIWAYGFRNPYSWSFDKLTGEMYVADVGQGMIEEVDRVFKAGNYGWPIKEGSFYFDPAGTNAGFITTIPAVTTVPPDLIDPIAEYDHDEGLSIIGGYMYRGTAFANLMGRYITGDFGRFNAPVGRLFVLDRDEFRELRIGTDDRSLSNWIKGFGEDQQGELYIFASTNLGPSGTSGKMIKIVPASYQVSVSGPTLTGTNVTVGFSQTGVGPYVLEAKSALDDRMWRVVAAATNETTVPMDTVNGFMRVRDAAGIRDSAFTVYMTGDAERPTPVTNPNALGTGALVIEGNTLHFDIHYTGLSGPAVAAHIHGPATAAGFANVLVNFQGFTGSGFSTAGVLSGSVTLTPSQKAAILSGKTYVNIHTGNNPNGEIRGQVAPMLWFTDMGGENERANSVNTPGRGSGLFMLVGNKLTFDIEYSDLKTNAHLAHIHGPASPAVAGPVMVDLAPFNGGAFGSNGTFTGTATLTPAQIAALVDGLTYVNVHTPNPFHPSGEIRGQIWPKSTAMPLTATLSGAAERPTVDTPATGSAVFALDGSTLHFNITYRGLKAVANNMHIHGLAASTNSVGVLIDLKPSHVGPLGTNGAIAGSVVLSDAHRAAILNGRTYVNVHSGAHNSGEIRGQIIPSVMHSVLLGASERPASVHESGRGRGTLLLARDQLNVNVTYEDLTTPAGAAHIHGLAPTSDFATVMVDLGPLRGEGFGTNGSLNGTVGLNATQLGALVDALTYINVHTGNNGGGEIRGQIIR